MECAHDATFNHRPKAIYGVGMDSATDIFSGAMMDHAMIEEAIKITITRVIIGRDQADLMRHSFIENLLSRGR